MERWEAGIELGGIPVSVDELPEEPDRVLVCGCGVLDDLVQLSNLIVDECADMAEFNRATTDPEHLKLRSEIMEHVHTCGGFLV